MNKQSSPENRLKIAIVGTGVAGMSAAWLLNTYHDITVYEKNDRIGGHSNTVHVRLGDKLTPVDTGFIVYNEPSYPNLTALFDHLGVPTKHSDMSFAASLGGGNFEYSGTDLNGYLGQRRNVLRPRFWRMTAHLLRFYKEAEKYIGDPRAADMSLGAYLAEHNYRPSFLKDHLMPMGAAIWSTTAAEMAAYPARAFFRFFESHGLLLLTDRPPWRTVDGGSRAYVERLAAPYRDKVRYHGVRSIKRFTDHVIIEDESGATAAYDHVVIAGHADEAYGMLSDPDELETSLLSSWTYTANRAVLHSDVSLMPKRKRVWSSWNFIEGQTGAEDEPLCVTYWMNLLQSLDSSAPVFVTLNPVHEPKLGKVFEEFHYTHPFFDQTALASQRKLWQLQGRNRTWFCGSYFGYGFHEDALQSGLAVGEQLGGVKRPWSVADENGRIHVTAKTEGVAA